MRIKEINSESEIMNKFGNKIFEVLLTNYELFLLSRPIPVTTQINVFMRFRYNTATSSIKT